MSRQNRSLNIKHLELPASLTRRPRLKALIEEELAILLEGSSLPKVTEKPSVNIVLREEDNAREIARKIATQILQNLE